MNRINGFLILLLFSSFAIRTSIADTFEPFILTCPQLQKGPLIDGKIDPNEWQQASGAPIALKRGSKELVGEGESFFRIGRVDDKLYFLFVVQTMKQMPRVQTRANDGEIWNDDSVELYFRTNGNYYVIIMNSEGYIYDAKNGDKGWNSNIVKSISLVGTEFAVGGNVERGFIAEMMIPLGDLGLPIPYKGDIWDFQVAFNQERHNPHAVWSPFYGILLKDSQFGKLIWLDQTYQIDSISVKQDEEPQVVLKGFFADNTKASISYKNYPETSLLELQGNIEKSISLLSGSEFIIKINNNNFNYYFEGKTVDKIDVFCVPVPSKQSFYVWLKKNSKNNRYEKLKLSLKDETTILWSKDVDVNQLNNDYVDWIKYNNFGESGKLIEFIVEKISQDNNLSILAQKQLRIPLKPWWADYKLPELPKLPDIFFPVKASKTEVDVWGRKYKLGGTLFVDQIISQDTDILADPVKLVGKVNGKDIKWEIGSFDLVKSEDDKALYKVKAKSEDLNIEIDSRIEFDGYVKYDLKLFGIENKEVKIQDLQLIIPVKSEIATLYSGFVSPGFAFNDLKTWNVAGKLPEGDFSSRFRNHFWLGNTKVGLAWFTENAVNWKSKNDESVIEVKNKGSARALILHILDGENTITEPFKLTFGLMASPVRPAPAKCDMSGNRIAVLTAAEQLIAEYSQKPQISIPIKPGDFTPSGCYEIDFKPMWDSNAFSESPRTIPLLWHGNSQGYSFVLEWSSENAGTFIVKLNNPKVGSRILGSSTVKLKRGEWYRLAINYSYGNTIEVFLNGNKVLSALLSDSAPGWDMNAGRVLGGGKMSLRGWRISRAIRDNKELNLNSEWIPDSSTVVIDKLQSDPTVMCMTNPEYGYLDSTAYLQGNWTYDKNEKVLIAGDDTPVKTVAEHMADYGVNGAIIFVWSKYGTGQGEIMNPPLLQKAFDVCNKAGIRLIPYTTHGIADVDPVYEDYKWEMNNNPPDTEPVPFWRDGHIQQYTSAPVEGYARWKIEFSMIEKLMKMGAGGVYLDGQAYPTGAINPLFELPIIIDPQTGKRIDGNDLGRISHIDAHRKFMWTMYKLIRHYRKDAIFDAHNSLGYTLSTMSMVTNSTNGESIGAVPGWQNIYTLERAAAEFTGRAFGFNAEALFYKHQPVAPEYGMAIMGINGSSSRLMWGMEPGRAKGLWRLMDSFGTNDATFYHYLEQDKPFSILGNSDNLRISGFVRQDKRVLLLVLNWGNEPVIGKIKIDWNRIGLDQSSVGVMLANRNEKLEVKQGFIELPLRPKQLNYVWIGDGYDCTPFHSSSMEACARN